MAWLVGAVVFALYAWTAAPGLTWLDSAELTTASITLGIAHPPGHPIPILLGKLAALLPVGDLAHRVNLASAVAGAIAAAAVAVAAERCARRVEPKGARAIGAAAGLAFGVAGAAWMQAVRAEVYSVEAALLAAALAWLLDGDARGAAAAAFAMGLALANHHYVTLLFMLPAAIAGGAAVLRASPLGALGLGAFLYLPLRAAHDVVGWGDPDRASHFAWTVSAQAFQKSLAGTQPPAAERALDLGTAIATDIGLVGAALALAGAYALARARAWRPLVLLAGVALTGAAGRGLLGFDHDNPDARGYLLPAFAALCVLAAAAPALVARVFPRFAPAVAALTFLWPATHIALGESMRDATAAERQARAILDPLPPRAVAMTTYFETGFLLSGLQDLEGARPDVDVLHWNLLTHPYGAAAARRRFPELAALIDDRLARGHMPGPAALDRPIAVEIDPHIRLDPRLVPAGALALLLPAAPTPDERALAEERDARAFAALAPTTTSPKDRHAAERVLAWSGYVRALFFCGLNRAAAARGAIVEVARRVPPDDPFLVDVERRCAER